MKDAFDVLMITHAGLCKGYADALKLILDIDEDDFGTLSFENGESLDDFSEAIRATIEERYKDRNLVVLLDLPGGSPANTALPFMSSSRKLIAGVNLPLVLEIMAMKKSGTTWEELDLDDTCKSAAQSIVLYLVQFQQDGFHINSGAKPVLWQVQRCLYLGQLVLLRRLMLQSF